MTSAAISVRNLTKVFQNGVSVTAVDAVSLEVLQAEFLAVTGPSGSGKSTLLNLLGTLDHPTSGELVIAGRNLDGLKGDELADFRREKIGFIFQLFNLVPTLTALENVWLPLLPYRKGLDFKPEERAKELLGQLGLAERLDHLPGQLSGGEQQRVCIARALINRPMLILADEPTGNLDTAASGNIIELLQWLNKELGITVVMVTHDESLASTANRRIHMVDGKIVDS
ncbi:MAG: ABC transporter ATP-binding protein [Anaerolineales bacterium]